MKKPYLNVSSVDELVAVTLQELQKNGPHVRVCGPFTTGGKGSVDLNKKEFADAVSFFQESALPVWDNIPFEDQALRLQQEGKLSKKDPYDLLKRCFLPLFESGAFTTVYFLPGWESSRGASWEHEQAKQLGINIKYLPENWREINVSAL
jgi:hypothetical protein